MGARGCCRSGCRCRFVVGGRDSSQVGQGIETASSSCSVITWLTSGAPIGMLSRFPPGEMVAWGAGGRGKNRVPKAPAWGKREPSMSFVLKPLRHWVWSKIVGGVAEEAGGT